MVYLAYYFIFCLTTALTSWYFLFWSALKAARLEQVENSLTLSPVLSSVAYIAVATITAPLLFVILVIPSFSDSYVQGMLKVLRDENN